MKDKTTTTTHTPGPWFATPPASAEESFTGRDETIWGIGSKPGASNVAVALKSPDARLIAAAPELLAALKAMMHADECISENRGHKSDQAMQRIAALDLATAAIARAEGGGK